MLNRILILCLILGILVNGCTTQKVNYNPKISLELQERLRNTDLERIHVIIVFNHEMNNTEYNEIISMNVTLFLIPFDKERAASIDIDKINDIAQLSYIAQINDLSSKDKIKIYGSDGSIPRYLINNDSTINVEVTCFKDVDIENCKEVIGKYGLVHEQMSSDSYRLSINESSITELAKNDVVYAIGKISPVIDLSEELK